jgi:hypothetical protein
MKNPQAYQAATISLNVDQQALLMEVMAIAQEEEANAAAESSA